MTTRQRYMRGRAVYPGKANNYHRWTAPTCRCGCGRAVPQRGRYRCYQKAREGSPLRRGGESRKCYTKLVDV